jgi:hypothetical protein
MAAATKPKGTSTGEDVIIKTIIELLGVGLLALVAGISDEFGNIMVVIMAGIMLIWLMTHAQELQKIVGKIQ